jgi:large subunit ribosomal protein L6
VLSHAPSILRGDRALHGLTRALLANMVTGVSRYDSPDIRNRYRAEMQGRKLLYLGYSHPIGSIRRRAFFMSRIYGRSLVVRGLTKNCGEIAARIRRQRPPEPYKGKGVQE